MQTKKGELGTESSYQVKKAYHGKLYPKSVKYEETDKEVEDVLDFIKSKIFILDPRAEMLMKK